MIDLSQKVNRARNAAGNNIPSKIFGFFGEGIAIALAKTPVHPNILTVSHFLITLSAAITASFGTAEALKICSWLLLVSGTLDCADGRLARRKNQCTRLGSYLDLTLDDLAKPALTVGFLVSFWNAGFRGLPLLAPVFVYFGDVLILQSLTRYRVEFIDPYPDKENLEGVFQKSFAMQLGRNLMPATFARYLLFALFAGFGFGFLFIILDAFYITALISVFIVKLGLDIYRKQQTETSNPPSSVKPSGN